MTAGDYSIGSGKLPGLAKLAEECGEVIQVIGKIIAADGAVAHWDGSNLMTRLEDEIADVLAAMKFFSTANSVDIQRMDYRTLEKLALFQRWHQEARDGSLSRDGH